jgi:hypothetical protein
MHEGLRMNSCYVDQQEEMVSSAIIFTIPLGSAKFAHRRQQSAIKPGVRG